MYNNFYISSLITKLHLVSQGNLILFTISKVLHNPHKITLLIPKLHTKNLESHKNLTQDNKTITCRFGITLDNT